MTEQEWHDSAEAVMMLEFCQGRGSGRKLRLFALACAGPLVERLGEIHSHRVLSVVEQITDGLSGHRQLTVARREAQSLRQDIPANAPMMRYLFADIVITLAAKSASHAAVATARLVRSLVRWPPSATSGDGVGEDADNAAAQAAQEQAAMLHCIFGNPFHPVTAEPKWLTTNVVSLAQAIYDQRRFQDMPILADALEDAGCTNPEVLAHAREKGPHVRGCWLVDLLLGKA